MTYLFEGPDTIPVDVVRSQGKYIIGKSGKRYLDFLTGWGVGNAGWNNPALMKTGANFKGPVYAMGHYRYEKWEVLAKKLVAEMPTKQYSCFRATGGTEAVELALKISRVNNKRKKFVAFKDAYHGQSFACMGLVGKHEEKFGPYPNIYTRLTEDFEKAKVAALKAIKSKMICAFIAEPIIVNLGVRVPPESFLEEIKEACERTDTVFIMDEVITGFGRTGEFFGFEHFNVKPDIVTIAKGFSSGHAVIGAAIASNDLAESMNFDSSNYSTFGWHPVSTEIAIENLRQIKSLMSNSREMGQTLMDSLSEFCEPEGRGLCIGFDANNEDFEDACRKDGLLLSCEDKRGTILPPLNIDETDIEKAVKIMKKNF